MPRRGGWRRLGRHRFRYVDSKGRKIEDEALERIRGLVIPPAWQDVWLAERVREAPGDRSRGTSSSHR